MGHQREQCRLGQGIDRLRVFYVNMKDLVLDMLKDMVKENKAIGRHVS